MLLIILWFRCKAPYELSLELIKKIPGLKDPYLYYNFINNLTFKRTSKHLQSEPVVDVFKKDDIIIINATCLT